MDDSLNTTLSNSLRTLRNNCRLCTSIISVVRFAYVINQCLIEPLTVAFRGFLSTSHVFPSALVWSVDVRTLHL